MNRMKERAMRWVSAILPILLLILGMASPALAAAHRAILLIKHLVSSPLTSCPNICPNRVSGRIARLLTALCMLGGLFSPASTADYDLPILRGSSQPPAPVLTVGPATFTRWSGQNGAAEHLSASGLAQAGHRGSWRRLFRHRRNRERPPSLSSSRSRVAHEAGSQWSVCL